METARSSKTNPDDEYPSLFDVFLLILCHNYIQFQSNIYLQYVLKLHVETIILIPLSFLILTISLLQSKRTDVCMWKLKL